MVEVRSSVESTTNLQKMLSRNFSSVRQFSAYSYRTHIFGWQFSAYATRTDFVSFLGYTAIGVSAAVFCIFI